MTDEQYRARMQQASLIAIAMGKHFGVGMTPCDEVRATNVVYNFLGDPLEAEKIDIPIEVYCNTNDPTVNWCVRYGILTDKDSDYSCMMNLAYAQALAQAMDDPKVQEIFKKHPEAHLEVIHKHGGKRWVVTVKDD